MAEENKGITSSKLVKDLDYWERGRELVLRVKKSLFEAVYQSDFKGNESVLEIGSGIGFLRRNWPREFNGIWIELDNEPAALKEAERRSPQGIYVCGSADKLPFPDQSFDAVCSLDTFDCQLEMIVREASRVLRKDGLFLQMLDSEPHIRLILKYFKNENIPYRIKESKDGDGNKHYDVEIIMPENLDSFDKAIKSVRDPEQKIRVWETYGKALTEVDHHDYFIKILIDALSQHFDIQAIKIEKLTAQGTFRRTEQQRRYKGDPFLFQWAYGRLDTGILADHINGYRVYRGVKYISPRLARFLEQFLLPCIETSNMMYVKARK